MVGRFMKRCLATLCFLLVCAGCRLDANVTVKVDRDGSGAVTLLAVADKDLVGRAGNALADLRFDDATNAGWTVEGPTATSSGGRQISLTKPFHTQAEADRILVELSGPSGPLHNVKLDQRRTFANITTKLTGEIGLDNGVAGLGDDELVQLLGGRPVLEGAISGNLSDQLFLTVSLRGPGIPVGIADISAPIGDATRTPVALQTVERDAEAAKARKLAYAAVASAFVLTGLVIVVLRRRSQAARSRQTVWRR